MTLEHEPAEAMPNAREVLRAVIVKHLADTEAMFCTRVWEAWGYGTMREDDFTMAADEEAWIDEHVELVADALAAFEAAAE